MPASKKQLIAHQHKLNREAGIGDENGRLPARVKPVEVHAKCTNCGQEIRVTKTNTELRSHAESKHPTFTFAQCFPGQFDPTAAPVSTAVESKPAAAPKPKAKKDDLSFLDAGLAGMKKK